MKINNNFNRQIQEFRLIFFKYVKNSMKVVRESGLVNFLTNPVHVNEHDFPLNALLTFRNIDSLAESSDLVNFIFITI